LKEEWRYVLHCEIVTCDGFFSSLLKVSDSIFCSRDGKVWKNMRDALWFITHHEEEWGGVMGVMFSMIIDEFCYRKMFNPIKRYRVTIDVKVSF